MHFRQLGFGGLQLIIAAGVMAVLAVVAVPKYGAFVDKSKITEAFNLASVSRKKLSEFYMMNNRFPQTAMEADASKTTSMAPPKFVREMIVEPGFQGHDIAIKVYLKHGVIQNETDDEQFVFILGDSNAGSDNPVSWSCGASGIGPDLLPDNCKAE